MEVKTYEEYLRLFTEEQGKVKGKNGFFIQQAFLALESHQGDWDSLEMADLPQGDYFTHLLGNTEKAMKEVWIAPHEKVVRVHKKMPSHKVREMDSYCVNWLSGKSGETKREKLALNPKIMGVKRQRSIDTGENRLFLAYMKKISKKIGVYMSTMPEEFQSPTLGHLHKKVRRQMRSEPWETVGQWQNIPPNHSLLSHKDYKVIWQGWRKLRHLDGKIADIFQEMDQYLLTVVEGHLLYLFQTLCACPQGNLCFSQEEGKFQREFQGIDGKGRLVTLSREENTLMVTCEGKERTLGLAEGNLFFSSGTHEGKEEKGDKKDKPISFQGEQVGEYLIALLHPLDLSPYPPRKAVQTLAKVERRMVDFFPLFPLYLDEEGRCVRLDYPLLLQSHKERKEVFSCEKSQALSLYDHNFHSIYGTLPLDVTPEEQEVGKDRNRTLIQEGKKSLPCEKLTLICPDGVDEFLLGDMQGNLRSVYGQVETLPKSLGLAFHHQHQAGFSQSDLVVVVDLLGNRLSMTPWKPQKEEQFLHKIGNQHPYVKDFQGLVWERHPTSTQVLAQCPKGLSADLEEYEKSLLEVFTLEGLTHWQEGFPFFTGAERVVFWDGTSLEKERVNVTEMLHQFLQERGGLLGISSNEDLGDGTGESGKARVVFLTSSPLLQDDKQRLLTYSSEEQYEGCFQFEKTQESLMAYDADFMLWRDMLPQLEIHLGIYEIPLVGANEQIRPQQGVAVNIPITDQMKLEKGKSTYRFKVKKEDSLQRYQAVVHRSAFGVEEEMELQCRLEMTYEYGAKEPYSLYLVPMGEGRRTKVEWVLQQEEDWQDLAYPPFPTGLSLDDILRGDSRHRVKWLESTWVPLMEPWEVVTGRDLESNAYSHETPTGEVRFRESDVERMVYQLEHPRYAHQRPSKNGNLVPLCYESRLGRGNNLTPIDRRLADQRFALYRLFFNGRGVEELPTTLARVICENMEQLEKNLPCKKDKVGEFHFLALCLFHGHLDDVFYDYCQGQIRQYVEGNMRFLPDALGYALGDLSRERERKLLETVCMLPHKKAIPILAKGMWNHENFVYACSSDMLLERMDEAVTRLGVLYRKLKEKPRNAVKIALCLEFMLGVFRLRATGEERICRKLSLNAVKMQELKSLISTMGDDPSCGHIYSNIQLKTRGASRRENFFHLFLLYLVGDLGGADIQIIQNLK